MNIINRFYQKWYLVIGGLGIAAGLLICMFLVGRMTQETSLQKGIADEIIRFHVIANSDSDEDQALKMKVKNEVVAYMETL